MRRVLSPGIFVALLLAVATATFGREGPPNVVIILTDDQGWGDISSHGNASLRTPHLDRLAATGARFRRFFVSPVCAPTRASLLTGRYSPRTGVHGVTRGRENMRAEEVTLAELFRDAGYATGCFGKWHNGAHMPLHPNGQGFDEFVGFCAGHWNNYFDPALERNGTPWRAKGYIADVLTDEAIGFIERNRSRPFLCYVPLNTPHSPWQVPDEYHERITGKGLDRHAACAYAMCENIDDNVGRLLARLDELDLTESTIVLFLTDNGPNSDRFNGGMKGRKGSVHEGGVRVPLFVRWPGRVAAGLEVDRIAMHIDVLPTLAEWCRLDTSRCLPLDGKSLVPLLEKRGVDWPDRRLFTVRSRGDAPDRHFGAVRTQRWRAVRTGMRRPWELYDMTSDPGQEHDLAKAEPELVATLAAAYEAHFDEVAGGEFAPLAIPVGHRSRDTVEMPAHEAHLSRDDRRGISYHGRAGWANDWITGWTDDAESARWTVDVLREGEYRVSVRYVCPAERVGARLRLECGERSVEARVERAHDPEPVPSPDRIPRGEVYEKEWARLELGVLRLDQGPGELRLRTRDLVGGQAPDVKSVVLERIR